VARAIHRASRRAGSAFVTLDCELSAQQSPGGERSAIEDIVFFDATLADRANGQSGIEAARGGTIYVNEITALSPARQAQLFQNLKRDSFHPQNGNTNRKSNFSLIAGSRLDPADAVDAGRLHRNLFFRLNELTISITPLRQRKEDILFLARRILIATNKELGKKVRIFSADAMEAMLLFDWPGNVRQLRTVVRRAVLMTDEVICREHLGIENEPAAKGVECGVVHNKWSGLSLKEIVRQSTMAVEREVLIETLRKTAGNKAKAARLLEIDYKTIHTKVKKYRIFV